MDRNVADGMKHLRDLAGFHTDSNRHLQVQSSAIHIWLHFMSLVWREKVTQTLCEA